MNCFKHGSKLVFWFDDSFKLIKGLDEQKILEKDYRIDELGQVSCFLNDISLENYEEKLDFIAVHLMITLRSFSKGIVLIPYDEETLKDSGFGIDFENSVCALDIDHYEITGVNDSNCLKLLQLGYEGVLDEPKHWIYDVDKFWAIIRTHVSLFRRYFKEYPSKVGLAKSVLKGHKLSKEYNDLFNNQE